jgi:6-phosphogluconolactonase
MDRVLCADASEVAQRAAARLRELVDAHPGGPFTIALSGGSTPKRLYERLELPWSKVELFFGDERSVPPDHPDSNYGMVKRALLDRTGASAHRMRAEEGDADGYQRLLEERVPAFDLVLLGLGTDGHTASLFPGTAALDEARRRVVMNEVPQLRTRRMTLTFPELNRARRAWVLACGADKKPVLEKLARGERYPIARVAPAGELTWWLDREAAP